MRHGKSGRKLNRTSSHRLAMFRNMVTSLLEHERIYTTDAKAKELRRWADWMITLGKRGDLHARRQALQVIRDKGVVHKLFTDLAQRYQARSGGYTRAVKMGFRPGDCAPISLVELMTGETAKKKRKKKRKFPKAEEAARVKAEVAAEAEGTEAVEEEAVVEEAPEKQKKRKRKTAKKTEAEAPAEEETLKPEPETSETSKGEPESTVEEATEPAAKKKKGKTEKGKKKTDKE
jgi:large subunit ribosomal protein L17